MRQLWPALVLSEPSEKPSVIHLKDSVVDVIVETFYTISIKLEIPESCVSAAECLWSTATKPSAPQPTTEEIEKGVENLAEIGRNNLKTYHDMLDKFLHILLEKSLHWRHRQMAMHFIYVMVHPEQIFPPQIVRFFLGALIHESLDERKIALKMMMYIFKQLKKKHIKVIDCIIEPRY